MAELSPARAKVLAFIEAQVAQTGRFPPSASIVQHMGWKGNSGAQDVLNALVLAGKIRVVSREQRNGVGGWRYHYALAKVAA